MRSQTEVRHAWDSRCDGTSQSRMANPWHLTFILHLDQRIKPGRGLGLSTRPSRPRAVQHPDPRPARETVPLSFPSSSSRAPASTVVCGRRAVTGERLCFTGDGLERAQHPLWASLNDALASCSSHSTGTVSLRPGRTSASLWGCRHEDLSWRETTRARSGFSRLLRLAKGLGRVGGAHSHDADRLREGQHDHGASGQTIKGFSTPWIKSREGCTTTRAQERARARLSRSSPPNLCD